jgi:Galactocerebrosidase, C-terminal lectin domain
MNRRLVLACVSGVLLTVTAGAYGQGNAPMTIDIAALAPDLEPEFTIWRTGQGTPAQWAIVADPTAAGGRAIAQTSTDKTDYRFPLAIYKPYSGKNLEVSVRFRPVSGSVDQAGGIAVRLQTPDDYYVVRANALEDNVRFYRVVKGKREQLAGANTKVATNTWHTLTLKADGDGFTISYDGKEMYTTRDTTFTEAGKVALWTKADSVTYFDNLTIRPLPEGGK